ncbi:MAG TPA: hypothetical protein ENI93_04940 [Gammaproteobacteria bacterium]|nr:hypothetical protein [Gammaproteobacteria bacterium]
MGIFEFVSNIFKPAVDLVDELNTSEEERLELKKQILKIENDLQARLLEYETKLMEAQASIVRAEAQSQSWIARNWRPITMLTMLTLVVFGSLGVFNVTLQDEFWLLLQIGLGGYVIGRSAEKIVPQLMKNRQPPAEG